MFHDFCMKVASTLAINGFQKFPKIHTSIPTSCMIGCDVPLYRLHAVCVMEI